MPARVLKWNAVPGKDLPEPLIEDDRGTFSPDVVRQVLEWLTSSQLRLQAEATQPEPIIIALGEKDKDGSIRFDTLESKVQAVSFTHGRIEVHMRDKRTRMILATYVFLCALATDGRQIIGPRLFIKQKAQV